MDEQELPYVIAGEWVDKDWMQAAAQRNVEGPDKEKHDVIYSIGPRLHPYGPKAFTVVVDNQPRIYPTEEASKDDLADHPDTNEPELKLNNVKPA